MQSMFVAGTNDRIGLLMAQLARARGEDMSREFRAEWDDTGSVAGPLMPMRDGDGVVGLTDPTGSVDDVVFRPESEGDPEFQHLTAIEDELRRLCGIADESMKGQQLLDEVRRRMSDNGLAAEMRKQIAADGADSQRVGAQRDSDHDGA